MLSRGKFEFELCEMEVSVQSEKEWLLSLATVDNDRCLSVYSEISDTSSGLEIFAADVSDVSDGSRNADQSTKKRARG